MRAVYKWATFARRHIAVRRMNDALKVRQHTFAGVEVGRPTSLAAVSGAAGNPGGAHTAGGGF
jgi:hypothetical protein